MTLQNGKQLKSFAQGPNLIVQLGQVLYHLVRHKATELERLRKPKRLARPEKGYGKKKSEKYGGPVSPTKTG